MATARKRGVSNRYDGGGAVDTEHHAKIPGVERSSAKPDQLDEQRVRERAYAIWVEEGQPSGRDVEHWLRAQGEVEQKAA